MKRSENILANTPQFSYKIPNPWGKGDLFPSPLYEHAKCLIDYILTHSPSLSDLIHLRSTKEFRQLYLEFHRELEEGTGVIFFKNFISCGDFSNENVQKIFMNVCLFIGEPVPINASGDIVREVKDLGLKDAVMKPARGHLTNQPLAFHSDRADITTLFCINRAYKGGEFKLGSSATLFSELEKRKEMLDIVSSNIPHDLRDEGRHNLIICSHPIVSYDEAFCVRYIRKFIESTARFGMTIEPKLKEALDYIDGILGKERFSHELVLKPGDFIMFNNHLTLHSRNAFIDNQQYQRCLLRIWLSSEFSRPLPESFQPIFHQVSAGSSRGGIR